MSDRVLSGQPEDRGAASDTDGDRGTEVIVVTDVPVD